jgi:hypothetical protein
VPHAAGDDVEPLDGRLTVQARSQAEHGRRAAGRQLGREVEFEVDGEIGVAGRRCRFAAEPDVAGGTTPGFHPCR